VVGAEQITGAKTNGVPAVTVAALDTREVCTWLLSLGAGSTASQPQAAGAGIAWAHAVEALVTSGHTFTTIPIMGR